MPIVRHPMYTGGLMLFPLTIGCYWRLLAAVVPIAGIVLRLLHEERFLDQNLPGYIDYRRKVP